MNNYMEVRVDLTPCDETMTDVFAALMCDFGYESFVPDAEGLTAYIKVGDFDDSVLKTIVAQFPFEDVSASVSWTEIEGQDWNAEWEKNYFRPIVVDDKCVIHSSFHSDVPKASYDIVIDPKMAFGTGHHQTTTLMLRRILELPMQGRALVDVGTGTGILAILAAMRGASPVNAIEIDEFAYVNALENVKLNNHAEINVILGDASALRGIELSDYLLANINKNIILNDIESYSNALKQGGMMLLSGFYRDDVDDIVHKATDFGLVLESETSLDNWASLMLKKV
ncbi:MAG: 50S ribosomal protein L11 methyltransferase [Muribaculum sp.]|nr:50S ribosomal protein L11 methyltransferase [Muribaculum sp.]